MRKIPNAAPRETPALPQQRRPAAAPSAARPSLADAMGKLKFLMMGIAGLLAIRRRHYFSYYLCGRTFYNRDQTTLLSVPTTTRSRTGVRATSVHRAGDNALVHKGEVIRQDRTTAIKPDRGDGRRTRIATPTRQPSTRSAVRSRPMESAAEHPSRSSSPRKPRLTCRLRFDRQRFEHRICCRRSRLSFRISEPDANQGRRRGESAHSGPFGRRARQRRSHQGRHRAAPARNWRNCDVRFRQGRHAISISPRWRAPVDGTFLQPPRQHSGTSSIRPQRARPFCASR